MARPRAIVGFPLGSYLLSMGVRDFKYLPVQAYTGVKEPGPVTRFNRALRRKFGIRNG